MLTSLSLVACGNNDTATLPDVNGMTLMSWNQAVSGDYLSNITETATQELYSEKGDVDSRSDMRCVTKYNKDILYQEFSEVNKHYAVRGTLGQPDLIIEYDADRDVYVADTFPVGFTFETMTIKATLSTMLLNKFALFSFDADKGCYTAYNFTISFGITADEFSVWIEDGKIVKYYYEATYDQILGGMYTIVEGRLSNAGTTQTLTLPEYELA